MVMYCSTERNKMNDIDVSKREIMTLSTEDTNPSAEFITTTSYSLDYSLMAIVFAILIFLWIQ